MTVYPANQSPECRLSQRGCPRSLLSLTVFIIDMIPSTPQYTNATAPGTTYVGPTPVSIVPFFLVAAVESVVQVEKVKVSDCSRDILSPFSAHLGHGVSVEERAEETDGLTGGGNKRHLAENAIFLHNKQGRKYKLYS